MKIVKAMLMCALVSTLGFAKISKVKESAAPDSSCAAMVESSSRDVSFAADLLQQITSNTELDKQLLLPEEKWKEAKLIELRNIRASQQDRSDVGRCAITLLRANEWKSDLIVIFRLTEELKDRKRALASPDLNESNLQRTLEERIRRFCNSEIGRNATVH